MSFHDRKPPSHLSLEERAKWLDEQRREDRKINWMVAIIMVVIGLMLVGATMLHAVLVYDDWRCAFAECRINKTEK